MNKMTPENLAIVFTPTLLPGQQDEQNILNMMAEAPILREMVTELINQVDVAFEVLLSSVHCELTINL